MFSCVVTYCSNATTDPLAEGIDYGIAFHANSTEYKFQPHERVLIGEILTYTCKRGYYR